MQRQEELKNKIRKVMILTPAYDGKVDIYFANALKETIILGFKYGIEIYPIYIAGDAVVGKVRNTLFAIAYKSDVDDVVFIDSDIGWDPNNFFKLLSHNVDIVGGTYRKKKPTEEYVIRIKEKDIGKMLKTNTEGLLEVSGLGMGFIKISRRALNKIWKNSEKYIENEEEKRDVFKSGVIKGTYYSEDISFCDLWCRLKEKVYLDTTVNCLHIGTNVYSGNFLNYMKASKETK